MPRQNECVFIGYVTRDVEVKHFQNGGGVATFGFNVPSSKQVNGQWENFPCWLECKAFLGNDDSSLFDAASSLGQKRNEIKVSGALKMEEWEGRDGRKNSKYVLVLTSIEQVQKQGNGNNNGYHSQPRNSQHVQQPKPATPAAPKQEKMPWE